MVARQKHEISEATLGTKRLSNEMDVAVVSDTIKGRVGTLPYVETFDD